MYKEEYYIKAHSTYVSNNPALLKGNYQYFDVQKHL